ncbi:MAG: hypothetical protein WC827_01405 [Candidatus Paceibacterota bacterium]|jgi:hypothetical protein
MKWSCENLFRLLIIWWKKKKKKVITVTNNTKERMFFLRRKYDFIEKKAIRLSPGQELKIVVEDLFEELIVRNKDIIILTIDGFVPVLVIKEGKEPNHYDFDYDT